MGSDRSLGAAESGVEAADSGVTSRPGVAGELLCVEPLDVSPEDKKNIFNTYIFTCNCDVLCLISVLYIIIVL